MSIENILKKRPKPDTQKKKLPEAAETQKILNFFKHLKKFQVRAKLSIGNMLSKDQGQTDSAKRLQQQRLADAGWSGLVFKTGFHTCQFWFSER